MRRLLLAISMTLTGAAHAASVNTDMVACHNRDTIYDLARISMDSGPEIFMAYALRFKKDGLCTFLEKGTQVTVVESHWKGASCVRVGNDACIWIVKSAISDAN